MELYEIVCVKLSKTVSHVEFKESSIQQKINQNKEGMFPMQCYSPKSLPIPSPPPANHS